MPGAPLFWRTATHARCKTSLRRTLSYSAWNLRPGSALAARYSPCCKARTGSAGIAPRTDPEAAGLALLALTGPLLHITRTDEAAALPITGGYAVRPAQPVLRPPPTPTRPAVHFPGSPVIGRHAPVTTPQVTGPGRASPVPAATLDTFRAPYAGEFLTAALPGSSPLPWPSPRFREARHSLARPHGRLSNDAAGFASCYGPHRRSPLQGF